MTINDAYLKRLLTPPYDGVPVEVTSLRKEGLHQQSEEIQTFNEQPEIVGHDTVMEENHHCFTRHLHGGTQEEGNIFSPVVSHLNSHVQQHGKMISIFVKSYLVDYLLIKDNYIYIC